MILILAIIKPGSMDLMPISCGEGDPSQAELLQQAIAWRLRPYNGVTVLPMKSIMGPLDSTAGFMAQVSYSGNPADVVFKLQDIIDSFRALSS